MATPTNAAGTAQCDYKHLTITSDEKNNATWCVMNNDPKACFTQELLDEITISQTRFANKQEHQFYILASAARSIFSLGGDLLLFRQLIQQQNKQALYQYMKQCIDTLYGISMLPACERIALVQGTAFGGGFEAALACDTIIAEKSATFGFPERLFNLFPGMGAYSYLIRRIEPVKAQKMIKSARTYSAEELYDMGVVDKLVPDGDGHDAVYNHIKHYKRYSNSYDSLKRIFRTIQPLNYNELLQIGEQWVNTAMGLAQRDMGLMERLAESQARLIASN